MEQCGGKDGRGLAKGMLNKRDKRVEGRSAFPA